MVVSRAFNHHDFHLTMRTITWKVGWMDYQPRNHVRAARGQLVVTSLSAYAACAADVHW